MQRGEIKVPQTKGIDTNSGLWYAEYVGAVGGLPFLQ